MIVVIKSSKIQIIMILIVYIVIFVMSLVMVPDEPELIIGVMLFTGLFFFRLCVCYGRTLIMDEMGCTIRFLKIEKKYQWDELKIKRIEDFNFDSERYESGVVFFKHPIRKPTWYGAMNYCFWVHPFSFFFVYFKKPPKALPEGKRYGKIMDSHLTWEPTETFSVYAVDEEEFLTQMKEWGVELADTRRKYRRRYY